MLSPKYGEWLASTGVSPLTLSTKRLPDCVMTGCKLPPVSPCARKRKQVGHTNRFQLHGCTEVAAASDLLGQAQVQRSARVGMNGTLRSLRTADFPVRGHDDTPCQEVLLPQIVSPLSASMPTHSQPCSSSPCSPSALKPEDMFYLVSRQIVSYTQPDAVLECLGSQWELHLPYLIKSSTLTDLYASCRKQRLPYPPPEPTGSKTGSRRRTGPHSRPETCLFHKKRKERKAPDPIFMQLSIRDPAICKEALSFALRTLYVPDTSPERWSEGVLAAAIRLGIPPLFERCLTVMRAKISPSTVCEFHGVASRYKEQSLMKECEKWLERHLVCELSNIYLKYLPFELLLKTIRSSRFFTPSEYHLFKTVLYWVHLQLNPTVQVLPTHTSIIHFFSSWPREGPFLEQPEGQKYSILFQFLHLHGITGHHHLQEIQRSRIFPQSWLLNLFSTHYYTLLRGGDMALTDFSQQAVRFGLIIDRVGNTCCSQTVALWGFFFQMRVAKTDSNTHTFSLQRLKQWDAELPSRAWQRYPISTMTERLVHYQVVVQSQNGDQWQDFCSGPIHHEFGLTKPSCLSEVFKLSGLTLPILVTFALALPPL
ncbi:hypothetical protein ACEWY4_003715 [Coilia grayii]|uniref:BTB/POZ domain-containing protein 16 n=1 Tax=Coilia grayii TaxID=363190 RepID=A0ABD1KS05_9TELE